MEKEEDYVLGMFFLRKAGKTSEVAGFIRGLP
jgi:hypothetical protein